MYDDMNRPLGSDPMRTQESSPWGGLIALAAVLSGRSSASIFSHHHRALTRHRTVLAHRFQQLPHRHRRRRQ